MKPFSGYENKNVIVLGYGRSGKSAVNALVSLGANPANLLNRAD